jgi:hypothetical protein
VLSSTWVGCLVVMAAAAVVYLTALPNPFVYDDNRVVVNNPSIVSLSNVEAIAIFEPARPVVNFSYAIDEAVWGLHPFGFHVTNLALHVLAVLLVYFFARRLAEDWDERAPEGAMAVRPPVVAFATALVFAVHPIMTEAVGYVSGRSELLCGVFLLSAFLAMRAWMRERTGGWLALGAVLWVLALASKEIAVAFPLLVAAYDFWIHPGEAEDRWLRVSRVYVPIAVVAAIAVTWRLGVFVGREYSDTSIHWEFLGVELDAIRLYLLLAIVPIGQTIFHSVGRIDSFADPRAVSAILTIAGVVLVIIAARTRQALIAFGLTWFLLMLVPSGVLVLLNRGEPMAEHRVYVAGAGLFLAMGQAIGWLAARFATARPAPRWILRTAVALGIVSLVGHTLIRNEVWASPVTLWSEAVDQAPAHWLPRQLLGEALHEAGDHAAAIQSFKIALELRPDALEAYNKLGMCEIEAGRLTDAMATFKQLQARDPKSTAALYGFGTIALVEGHPDAARSKYLETITQDPSNIQARRGLAVLAETVGNDPQEALRWCGEIEQIAPGTPGTSDCIARNQDRVARRSDGR